MSTAASSSSANYGIDAATEPASPPKTTEAEQGGASYFSPIGATIASAKTTTPELSMLVDDVQKGVADYSSPFSSSSNNHSSAIVNARASSAAPVNYNLVTASTRRTSGPAMSYLYNSSAVAASDNSADKNRRSTISGSSIDQTKLRGDADNNVIENDNDNDNDDDEADDDESGGEYAADTEHRHQTHQHESKNDDDEGLDVTEHDTMASETDVTGDISSSHSNNNTGGGNNNESSNYSQGSKNNLNNSFASLGEDVKPSSDHDHELHQHQQKLEDTNSNNRSYKHPFKNKYYFSQKNPQSSSEDMKKEMVALNNNDLDDESTTSRLTRLSSKNNNNNNANGNPNAQQLTCLNGGKKVSKTDSSSSTCSTYSSISSSTTSSGIESIASSVTTSSSLHRYSLSPLATAGSFVAHQNPISISSKDKDQEEEAKNDAASDLLAKKDPSLSSSSPSKSTQIGGSKLTTTVVPTYRKFQSAADSSNFNSAKKDSNSDNDEYEYDDGDDDDDNEDEDVNVDYDDNDEDEEANSEKNAEFVIDSASRIAEHLHQIQAHQNGNEDDDASSASDFEMNGSDKKSQRKSSKQDLVDNHHPGPVLMNNGDDDERSNDGSIESTSCRLRELNSKRQRKNGDGGSSFGTRMVKRLAKRNLGASLLTKIKAAGGPTSNYVYRVMNEILMSQLILARKVDEINSSLQSLNRRFKTQQLNGETKESVEATKSKVCPAIVLDDDDDETTAEFAAPKKAKMDKSVKKTTDQAAKIADALLQVVKTDHLTITKKTGPDATATSKPASLVNGITGPSSSFLAEHLSIPFSSSTNSSNQQPRSSAATPSHVANAAAAAATLASLSAGVGGGSYKHKPVNTSMSVPDTFSSAAANQAAHLKFGSASSQHHLPFHSNNHQSPQNYQHHHHPHLTGSLSHPIHSFLSHNYHIQSPFNEMDRSNGKQQQQQSSSSSPSGQQQHPNSPADASAANNMHGGRLGPRASITSGTLSLTKSSHQQLTKCNSAPPPLLQQQQQQQQHQQQQQQSNQSSLSSTQQKVVPQPAAAPNPRRLGASVSAKLPFGSSDSSPSFKPFNNNSMPMQNNNIPPFTGPSGQPASNLSSQQPRHLPSSITSYHHQALSQSQSNPLSVPGFASYRPSPPPGANNSYPAPGSHPMHQHPFMQQYVAAAAAQNSSNQGGGAQSHLPGLHGGSFHPSVMQPSSLLLQQSQANAAVSAVSRNSVSPVNSALQQQQMKNPVSAQRNSSPGPTGTSQKNASALAVAVAAAAAMASMNGNSGGEGSGYPMGLDPLMRGQVKHEFANSSSNADQDNDDLVVDYDSGDEGSNYNRRDSLETSSTGHFLNSVHHPAHSQSLRHVPSAAVDQLELSEEAEAFISRDVIKRCIRKAKHRGNFAANLAAEIFSKEERISCNCTGTRGKRQLSPRRLQIVKEITFRIYNSNAATAAVLAAAATPGNTTIAAAAAAAANAAYHDFEEAWRKECITAIDAKNRSIGRDSIKLTPTPGGWTGGSGGGGGGGGSGDGGKLGSSSSSGYQPNDSKTSPRTTPTPPQAQMQSNSNSVNTINNDENEDSD